MIRLGQSAGGPLALPPLVTVTHSSQCLPAPASSACDRKFPPRCGAIPTKAFRLLGGVAQRAVRGLPSALYGAAGRPIDVVLTRLLLARGANPNDGESLYHSLENPSCTKLLLEAGARVTGTNALYRSLDLDDPEPLRLLLAHGGDANEPATSQPTSDWGTPLLWAIRRRRSPDHIAALLDAGADPLARTPDERLCGAAIRPPEVAELLRRAGGGERLEEVAFVAACAAGDEARRGGFCRSDPA